MTETKNVKKPDDLDKIKTQETKAELGQEQETTGNSDGPVQLVFAGAIAQNTEQAIDILCGVLFGRSGVRMIKDSSVT